MEKENLWHQQPHIRHRSGKAYKAGQGVDKVDPWARLKNRMRKKIPIVRLDEQEKQKVVDQSSEPKSPTQDSRADSMYYEESTIRNDIEINERGCYSPDPSYLDNGASWQDNWNNNFRTVYHYPNMRQLRKMVRNRVAPYIENKNLEKVLGTFIVDELDIGTEQRPTKLPFYVRDDINRVFEQMGEVNWDQPGGIGKIAAVAKIIKDSPVEWLYLHDHDGDPILVICGTKVQCGRNLDWSNLSNEVAGSLHNHPYPKEYNAGSIGDSNFFSGGDLSVFNQHPIQSMKIISNVPQSDHSIMMEIKKAQSNKDKKTGPEIRLKLEETIIEELDKFKNTLTSLRHSELRHSPILVNLERLERTIDREDLAVQQVYNEVMKRMADYAGWEYKRYKLMDQSSEPKSPQERDSRYIGAAEYGNESDDRGYYESVFQSVYPPLDDVWDNNEWQERWDRDDETFYYYADTQQMRNMVQKKIDPTDKKLTKILDIMSIDDLDKGTYHKPTKIPFYVRNSLIHVANRLSKVDWNQPAENNIATMAQAIRDSYVEWCILYDKAGKPVKMVCGTKRVAGKGLFGNYPRNTVGLLHNHPIEYGYSSGDNNIFSQADVQVFIDAREIQSMDIVSPIPDQGYSILMRIQKNPNKELKKDSYMIGSRVLGQHVETGLNKIRETHPRLFSIIKGSYPDLSKLNRAEKEDLLVQEVYNKAMQKTADYAGWEYKRYKLMDQSSEPKDPRYNEVKRDMWTARDKKYYPRNGYMPHNSGLDTKSEWQETWMHKKDSWYYFASEEHLHKLIKSGLIDHSKNKDSLAKIVKLISVDAEGVEDFTNPVRIPYLVRDDIMRVVDKMSEIDWEQLRGVNKIGAVAKIIKDSPIEWLYLYDEDGNPVKMICGTTGGVGKDIHYYDLPDKVTGTLHNHPGLTGGAGDMNIFSEGDLMFFSGANVKNIDVVSHVPGSGYSIMLELEKVHRAGKDRRTLGIYDIKEKLYNFITEELNGVKNNDELMSRFGARLFGDINAIDRKNREELVIQRVYNQAMKRVADEAGWEYKRYKLMDQSSQPKEPTTEEKMKYVDYPTFFRVQHKGISFEQMKRYQSKDGGDGVSRGKTKSIAATLQPNGIHPGGSMFGGSWGAMDDDDDVVIFKGQRVADLYDGYLVKPLIEMARFTKKEYKKMIDDETAWDWEDWGGPPPSEKTLEWANQKAPKGGSNNGR
jgi:hypothetical protein